MRLERLRSRLESPRLTLRCFEQSDVDALFTSVQTSREHLERWLSWPCNMRTLADVQTWVERVAPERYDATEPFSMGLFTKPTGQLVGAAGLKQRCFKQMPGAHMWLDISYWIDAGALGNGYAREAVLRLTRHGFDDLCAPRVELRIETDNAPSIRIAEEAGFRREGVLRATMARGGQLRDLAVYSLLPSDALPEPPFSVV